MSQQNTNIETKIAEKRENLTRLYNNDSNFLTFLTFFNSATKHHINSEFDLGNSLKHKINAIYFFKTEILQQIEKVIEEEKECKKNGWGSSLETTILLIKFESLLNAIYSICDNVSYIGHKLHDGLPFGFNKQYKGFDKYLKKYPKYEDYLNIIKNCEWYIQLHTMRTESTHYLPGFICYPDPEKLGVLYQNMIHSNDKILIEDISSYIIEIVKDIDEFLDDFSIYAITNYLSDESKTGYMCLIRHQNPDGSIANLVGLREVTYKEYKEKEVGTCIIRDVPCPDKEYCPAYKF